MASQTVGVLIIYRHGDRTAFYQNPNSYTASNTAITSLGEAQAFQLGQLIRNRYIDQSSPYAIQGFNDQVLNANQVYFSADAGGEGGVILDSAAALSQGAFPSTTASNITLANGTTVISPLGGYQYVPIESVEVADDYTLESWTDCPAYTVDNTNWYSSPAFLQKAQQSQASLTAFSTVVGERNVTFSNMYNIFDFINVEYLHSAAFMRNVSDSIYRQARDLANWHEYFSFSDPDPSSIGSIPGSAFLPVLFNSFTTLTNTSQPIKLRTVGISYKPFIGFFNLTGVAQTYPDVAGIVDYAAALAFEIRYVRLTNSYTITLQFKNGTYDNDFRTLNMFGSSDPAYPLSQFVSKLQPYSVSSLTQWCQMCNNTKTRGCDAVYALNQTTTQLRALQSGGSSSVSPVAAGFIGAGITVALASAVLLAMFLLGMASFGRKGMRQLQKQRDRAAETYALPAYDNKRQEAAVEL